MELNILEKPSVVQLLKNFPAFYGTRSFIIVVTRARHRVPESRRRRREPSAWVYNRASLFLGDTNKGTWPSRLGGLESEKENAVMSPAGLGPENDYADEAQQQL
jgi:hypothetical protein